VRRPARNGGHGIQGSQRVAWHTASFWRTTAASSAGVLRTASVLQAGSLAPVNSSLHTRSVLPARCCKKSPRRQWILSTPPPACHIAHKSEHMTPPERVQAIGTHSAWAPKEQRALDGSPNLLPKRVHVLLRLCDHIFSVRHEPARRCSLTNHHARTNRVIKSSHASLCVPHASWARLRSV